MSNRRKDYRHAFAPTERLQVELTSTGDARPRRGEIVNLSTSGMAVRLDDGAAFKADERFVAQLHLGGDTRLSLSAAVVRAAGDADGSYGFHFPVPADPIARAAREKAIWAFLLREQCRRRRLSAA